MASKWRAHLCCAHLKHIFSECECWLISFPYTAIPIRKKNIRNRRRNENVIGRIFVLHAAFGVVVCGFLCKHWMCRYSFAPPVKLKFVCLPRMVSCVNFCFSTFSINIGVNTNWLHHFIYHSAFVCVCVLILAIIFSDSFQFQRVFFSFVLLFT